MDLVVKMPSIGELPSIWVPGAAVPCRRMSASFMPILSRNSLIELDLTSSLQSMRSIICSRCAFDEFIEWARSTSICFLGSQFFLLITLKYSRCWANTVYGPGDALGRYAVMTRSCLWLAPWYSYHTHLPRPLGSSPEAWIRSDAFSLQIWAVPPYCRIDWTFLFSFLL